MLTYDLTQDKISQDNCDPLFEAAVKLIQSTGKVSTTFLQRKLSVGYARAAKILDEIESAGLVGPSNGASAREIFMEHNTNVWETLANKIPEPIEEEKELPIDWNKTKYTEDKSDDFEINLGVGENNKKVNLKLDKYVNLMIIGSQFTSVVNLLNNVLVNSMATYSPEELRVIAIDGIKGDLIVPNQASHLLTPLIIEPEKSISALKWAVSEAERRLKAFFETGSSDIKEWNKNTEFIKMPNILFVINSLEQLLFFCPSEIEDNLCRLFSLGRRTGIFFVIGSNYIGLKNFKTIISNNVAKLVFKSTDKNVAKSIGVPESIDLASPDEAILSVIFEENKKVKIKKLNPKEIYEEVFR